MIKKLWLSASSIGIIPGDDEKSKKRLTLINQYTFIAFILFVVNGVNDFLMGFYSEAIFLEGSSVIFIFALCLNKYRHHLVSITLLFVFVSLTIFFFCSKDGIQTGDYLYYFPLILSLSFAFDYKIHRFFIVSIFIFIMCLMLINIYTYDPVQDADIMDESSRREAFALNLVLSMFTLGFFIYLTIKNNEMISSLYEQRLNEKEKNEALIKKSLIEKDLLMAELHHRVKNNLAIMVGFFNLRMNTTDNEEARSVLLESKNRVNSMALIHNHLYQKEDVSEINFDIYIRDLVNEIKTSYPSLANSVLVECDIANVKLDLNTAVPCALILNELLTNCYKHAFKGRSNGLIRIEFKPFGKHQYKLNVYDSGVGFKNAKINNNSLGMSVIEALTQQLNGVHTYTSDKGTLFELVFKPVVPQVI